MAGPLCAAKRPFVAATTCTQDYGKQSKSRANHNSTAVPSDNALYMHAMTSGCVQRSRTRIHSGGESCVTCLGGGCLHAHHFFAPRSMTHLQHSIVIPAALVVLAIAHIYSRPLHAFIAQNRDNLPNVSVRRCAWLERSSIFRLARPAMATVEQM